MKYKPVELLQRLNYATEKKLFEKDIGGSTASREAAEAAAQAAGMANGLSGADLKDPLKLFGGQLKAMRGFACDLLELRNKEVFQLRSKQAVGKDYPNCDKLDDYLLEVRVGDYGNKMRGMIDTLCNQMWGSETAKIIERQVMDKLKLAYENLVFEGETGPPVPPKTQRTVGTFGKMSQRVKQTCIIDRFRYDPSSVV